MAALVYVVRRVPGGGGAAVEVELNRLVADGYAIVQVVAHGSTPPSPEHEGRTCVIDIIGAKK